MGTQQLILIIIILVVTFLLLKAFKAFITLFGSLFLLLFLALYLRSMHVINFDIPKDLSIHKINFSIDEQYKFTESDNYSSENNKDEEKPRKKMTFEQIKKQEMDEEINLKNKGNNNADQKTS